MLNFIDNDYGDVANDDDHGSNGSLDSSFKIFKI